jgi:uncharacterized protein (TIGR03067 family)
MNMTLKGALAFTAVSSLLLCLQAGGAPRPAIASELQLLQGTWEGVMVGDELHQKIIVTITNNSFHFHRDKNFWFETTITLPAGTDPKQLHATIKGCAPGQESSVGKVVLAILKIEDGTLTLAVDGDEPPKTFEGASSHYNLKKAQPQTRNAEASTSKQPEAPENAPANPDPVGIFDGIIKLPF